MMNNTNENDWADWADDAEQAADLLSDSWGTEGDEGREADGDSVMLAMSEMPYLYRLEAVWRVCRGVNFPDPAHNCRAANMAIATAQALLDSHGYSDLEVAC